MALDPKSAYVEYRRKRALSLAVGIALMVASFGISNLFMLLPSLQARDATVIARVLDKIVRVESHQIVDVTFSDKHVLAPFSLIATITIAIIVLGNARADRHALSNAYAFLSPTFTAEEERRARALFGRCLVAGSVVGAVACGTIAWAVLARSNHLGLGLGGLMAGVGVGLIVYAANCRLDINVLIYNYQALRRRSIYSLERDLSEAQLRPVRAVKRMQMHLKTIDQTLTAIGALASLALLLIPSLRTALWWVPLACALLACFAITHCYIRRARPLCQEIEARRGEIGAQCVEEMDA